MCSKPKYRQHHGSKRVKFLLFFSIPRTFPPHHCCWRDFLLEGGDTGATAGAALHSDDIHVCERLIGTPGGRIDPGRPDMSEGMISRRGAFSLLGLAAALGFGVPTTMLTMSDAEAQAQPTDPAPSPPAPSTPAPSASTPSAPATSGMNRRQARRAGRHERREARRGNNLYMKSDTTKQK